MPSLRIGSLHVLFRHNTMGDRAPLPAIKANDAEVLAKLLSINLEAAQALLKKGRPATIPPDVLELQSKIRSKDKYSIELTETRNVLMVGRTRSGKTTVIGVLKDPCVEPSKMSIFSDPSQPKCQGFSINNKSTNTKYTINVIDTPGLKEVARKGETKREDKEIMETVTTCLNAEITKIHVLVMVTSFEAGITDDDVNAFRIYMDKFWNEGMTAIICITRAEDKKPVWRTDLISQLHSHTYFKSVLDKPNMHVCFMGCVSAGASDSLITADSAELEAKYDFVIQLRKEFLELIFRSKNHVRLLDLPVTVERQNMVTDLIQKMFEQINSLNEQNDFTSADNQQKIKTFHEDLVLLLSWEALLYEDGVNALFKTLKWQLSELIKAKPGLTPSDKQLLRFTLTLDL